MTKHASTDINSLIDAVCDIMRRGNMAGAMQYVPELTWLLFLRMLDETETTQQRHSEVTGEEFSPSIEKPFRWRDWADKGGEKHQELIEGKGNALLQFVNTELFPYLCGFGKKYDANERQRVISQVFRYRRETKFTAQRDMLDVLDKLNEIQHDGIDDTHIFVLSEIYENLLLKMGEKNNDGGQFFTPREVIRAMVQTVNPKVGDRVYDPCCGTGGFLAQAYEHMRAQRGRKLNTQDIQTLGRGSFFGREKDEMVYPITLANLVLHGIDVPHISNSNTLSREEMNGSLLTSRDDPVKYEVILTNPPFGGKEAESVQTNYDYKTSKTQVLFLQEVIASLKEKGRCGIVVDEGMLFQQTDYACVNTRKRLLTQCELWCLVSLPGGTFAKAGAGVKTNILFFTKGKPTKSVWYYDLSQVKVTKTKPLTLEHFDEFFKLLPKRVDGLNSWSVDIETIKANGYDLKAVNPNRKDEGDKRTPVQLLASIEEKQQSIAKAIAELKKSL